MTVIISHTKDLDGLAAAAILLRENPGSSIYLVDYAEEYVKDLKRKLSRIAGEKIMIVDVGCNRRTIGMWASLLTALKERGSRIYWFDHHEWDEECLGEVNNLVEQIVHSVKDLCAAEIVWRKLGRHGDPIERRLAILAHDSDFNIWREPLSHPLSKLISFYHNIGGDRGDELKRMLVTLLSTGIFWTFAMDQQLEEYEEILQRDYGILVKNSRTIDVKGCKIVISMRGAYSGTDAANILFEELGGDIAILVSSRGSISVRSRRDDVNTKVIGEAFGGGGHLRYAAGGSIDDVFPNPDWGQIDEIARFMADRLSQIDFRLKG